MIPIIVPVLSHGNDPVPLWAAYGLIAACVGIVVCLIGLILYVVATETGRDDTTPFRIMFGGMVSALAALAGMLMAGLIMLVL